MPTGYPLRAVRNPTGSGCRRATAHVRAHTRPRAQREVNDEFIDRGQPPGSPPRASGQAAAWLLPGLLASAGRSDMILVPAAVALLGVLATLLLPEPKGRSLEEIGDDALPRGSPAAVPLTGAARPSGGWPQ